jgi:hypothetical protein
VGMGSGTRLRAGTNPSFFATGMSVDTTVCAQRECEGVGEGETVDKTSAAVANE